MTPVGFVADMEHDTNAINTATNHIPSTIEPNQPKPTFTISQVVTSNTIIPTCFFTILSIHYDTEKERHFYLIKSLPRVGDRCMYIRREPAFQLSLNYLLWPHHYPSFLSGLQHHLLVPETDLSCSST
jgi:hypothetical protein